MQINLKINTTTLYKTLMTALIFLIGSTVLLLNSSRWLARRWGVLNLEQLIFHMRAPTVGSNPDLFWDFAIDNLPIVFFITMVVTVTFIQSLKWQKKRQHTMLMVTTTCFFGLALLTWNHIWIGLDVQAFVENQQEFSTFVEDHYIPPETVTLTFPEERQNLIYIYLESMETTFMSTVDGGAFSENLIPDLTALARDNVNFSPTNSLGGAHVTTGSTWTSAGMFAQTAGLPLDVPINGDAILADSLLLTYEDVPLFPREIITLGDILEAEGYHQVLMMGSDATFGGRRYYFTNNGNYEIFDYNTAISQGLIPEDYHVWWGFEDERLLTFAQEMLTELGQSDQPFNLTLLTADTHFEDGFLGDHCPEPFETQYANVLLCSSRQIYDFVRWIQEQPFYENTTVVIVGDHLTMQSLESPFWEEFPIADGYARMVYNAFINVPFQPESTTNRTFTTMDLFPTTLASLGVEIEGERLGLGTNLFSNVPTLAEEVGLEEMNRELEQSSTFFDHN